MAEALTNAILASILQTSLGTELIYTGLLRVGLLHVSGAVAPAGADQQW
jgi:Na+/phosphate symporter